MSTTYAPKAKKAPKAGTWQNDPASPSQVQWIGRCLAEREVPDALQAKIADAQDGTLTKGTASALLDELFSCPKVAKAPKAAEPQAPLPDVPQGHYAIPRTLGDSDDLLFYRVDRIIKGKYAGRTFVKRVIGGHADHNVYGAEARSALEAIATDIPGAAKRYGVKIGRCSACNRHLTDPLSRSLGIGPECRSK